MPEPNRILVVLGWFSGAAESGRRALGHRSIVADPRIPGMKERLNAQIRFPLPVYVVRDTVSVR
jgi:predicted NodU family carbamoyl transferase